MRDARQETDEYVRPGVVRVREFNETRNNGNNNNSFNNTVQGNTITRQQQGDLNDVFDDYVYIILVFFRPDAIVFGFIRIWFSGQTVFFFFLIYIVTGIVEYYSNIITISLQSVRCGAYGVLAAKPFSPIIILSVCSERISQHLINVIERCESVQTTTAAVDLNLYIKL